MKPYIIIFENGLEAIIYKETIEQVKKRSANFAKYGKLINGEFSCCHNMSYTTRNATKKEIESDKARREEVQREFDAVTKRNSLVERCNNRLMNATNHRQFMRAYKELDDYDAFRH